MATQTHNNYQKNLVLPISSQDHIFLANNNLQQEEHYMIKRRNLYENPDNLVFLRQSKKQKFEETNASTITSDNHNYMAMNFEQRLCLQIEKQRNEIDTFVNLQNEWLKMALHEQRKQQLGTIIKKLEAKAMQLLQQKDAQILEATKKSIELQELVTKFELENQSWQRIALENESIAFSLNNTLQQLINKQQQQEEVCSSSSSTTNLQMSASLTGKPARDSTAHNSGFSNSRQHQNRPEEVRRVICKVCKYRNACVIMLPCRHMCCCKECDVTSDACPVCKLAKMASVDVLF